LPPVDLVPEGRVHDAIVAVERMHARARELRTEIKRLGEELRIAQDRDLRARADGLRSGSATTADPASPGVEKAIEEAKANLEAVGVALGECLRDLANALATDGPSLAEGFRRERQTVSAQLLEVTDRVRSMLDRVGLLDGLTDWCNHPRPVESSDALGRLRRMRSYRPHGITLGRGRMFSTADEALKAIVDAVAAPDQRVGISGGVLVVPPEEE
jgi:hypothetical protein